MRLWLVAVWVFFFLDGQGQVLMLKSPRQLMEKGKWKQALDLLQRNLRRDSLDVVSQYGVASWYASSRNPGSQIDSAHTWIRKSLLTYSRKSARERERLKRDQLDSSRLFGLKLTVDSLAFQRAKAQHSVDAYQYFTVAFFDALQVLQTIELRNELAYADALRLHTEDGYLGYLMRYPGSAREADARARLHRLQFEQAARIGTWEAFGDFTTKYPDNPYRGAAEKKIFEIVTAGGNPRDFNNFIKGYPASPWAKVARDFLFHLKPDSTDFPWSDSLRLEQRLSEGFLLPFVSSGKIGFVDEHGKVVVPATFEDLTDACRCEPVTQPILISPSSGVFSRQLKHLSSFKDNVQWFSTGHLFVSNDSTGALYHASGRLLLSDVEEIEPLESFLAFRKRNHWGLASLAGVELMPPAWEQLQVVGEFLLATRLGKRHIFPLSAIARVANRQPLPQPLVADDFRQFGDRYHVRNGALEGLVDASLKEVVPLDRQQISVYDQLVVVKKEKYSIRGFPPIDPARQYDQLVVKTPWMKTQEGILFHLYHMPRQQLCIHQADSVWFDQSLALSRKADSLHIFFPSGQSLRFAADAEVNWVESADSVRYFYTVDKLRKEIFDIRTGKRLFAAEADQVQSMGEFLVIIRNGKKGLLTREGKVILSPEYDHFLPVATNRLSLLKDKKFGLYDLATGRVIKPTFERNIIQVSAAVLIGFSQGRFGFISWDARARAVFEFDEVLPWADSLVWVKQDHRWRLISASTRQALVNDVRNFSILNSGRDTQVARIQVDEYYGLYSPRHGMVLAPTYHAIGLFAPGDKPVFRAEKNVEEAGIFIVMYFDEAGKLLYRMALEEVDYNRLECDD